MQRKKNTKNLIFQNSLRYLRLKIYEENELFGVHCTLYTVHCTLYTVHCTLYTVHPKKIKFRSFDLSYRVFWTIEQKTKEIKDRLDSTVRLVSFAIFLCCLANIFFFKNVKTLQKKEIFEQCSSFLAQDNISNDYCPKRGCMDEKVQNEK